MNKRTKILIKPIYPREPNYKPISCKVIKNTKYLTKTEISLEELNTEIELILKKHDKGENFHIIIHKDSYQQKLGIRYDIVNPLTDAERNSNSAFNDLVKDKYLNQVEEYKIKLQKYKEALEKELISLK